MFRKGGQSEELRNKCMQNKNQRQDLLLEQKINGRSEQSIDVR